MELFLYILLYVLNVWLTVYIARKKGTAANWVDLGVWLSLGCVLPVFSIVCAGLYSSPPKKGKFALVFDLAISVVFIGILVLGCGVLSQVDNPRPERRHQIPMNVVSD